MNRIELVDSDKCVGCAACASACPTHSITMKEDKEGFLQPRIDKKTCIGCHKCQKTCPIINKESESKGETKAYAAINKDDSVRAKSSSGGIFHALAKWTIEQKGVVFGARFDEKWEVMHDYCETLEGIIPFMGSKYVQSRIGDTYRQARNFLEQGRWVLFSGTPCQLAGLRAFLGKQYERLIQVDLICHGVPSPSVWRSYLKDFVTDGEILSISFRDKEEGWLHFQNVTTTTTTTTTIREHQMENPYFRGFLKNVYLRKSCYDCSFKTLHRNTDITLADSWGIDHYCPEMNDDRGTSLVIIHSKKALQLFTSVANLCYAEIQNLSEALFYNSMMIESVSLPKHHKRDVFLVSLKLFGFKKSCRYIDTDILFVRLAKYVKKRINAIVK